MKFPAAAGMSSGSFWPFLVGGWSLLFAAPHFYWAAGGRAGLGSQAGAADAALQQTWFVAYNLAAGCLGILGVVLALALARGWGRPVVRHWLVRAAAAAAVGLILRGAVGLTLLGVELLRGTFDGQTPAILLAIEPWFVLGGVAYGGMVVRSMRGSRLRRRHLIR